MLYDNEVVMLILGTAVLLFVSFNKSKIRRIISWKWLILAFYFLMGGWLFTVLEGIFMETGFNYLEHISYAVSAIILAIWCRKTAIAGKEAEQ